MRDETSHSQHSTAFATQPPAGSEYLRWSPNGQRRHWYRPDYHRCLTGVLPTVLTLLGHEPQQPSLLPYLPAAAPRQAKWVVLLTVDSFGYREWAHSRQLQQLYPDYGTWITSVFPSITSCALSSLYQSLAPARHGLTGHKIWKDCPGAVVDVLTMQVEGASHSLTAAGFNPHVWKRQAGILERQSAESPPGYHLLPRFIANSGLSTFSYGNIPRIPYGELIEGFQKATRMLNSMDQGFVSLYMPMIDTLTHTLGGGSGEVGLAVRHLEDLLAYLANSVPPEVAEDTAVMIVADHGQSGLQKRRPLHGAPLEWLQSHTHALGFSGRVMHVYLKDYPAEPVRHWLQDWLGEDGEVCEAAEVMPLVGTDSKFVSAGQPPLDPAWIQASLGDLVVILEEGVLFQRHPPPDPEPLYPSRFVSQHGALTWHELFVPLLCAPLSMMRV